MNETNEELNDAIDRNLRDAHEQIQFRPEWAERVLREIASEVERSRSVGRTGKSWRGIAALAAGLLLAVLGSMWLASPNRERSDDFGKSIASNSPEFSAQTETVQQSVKSVTAGPGYLAASLSNETEFEIYVVLPTVNVANKH